MKYSGDLCNRDPEQWFFFIPRQESEARGGRPRRLTSNGYWKATGSPGYIYANDRCIGMKRTMVFYTGRAPHGQKTDWKMNEYKAINRGEASSSSSTKLRQEFSLCRVYKNSKCLRAFDRRPVGVEMRGQAGVVHDQEAATSTGQIQQSPPVAERMMTSSSPESCSSGDHANISYQAAGESSNLPMPSAHNSEPVWDDWLEPDGY
ncbi:hypothetical protein Tsubulata_001313 [Turnera subulata]|uniref:NAC domain-containing protein n=1 Tax=Turnera subulata TaxID=218843 RepID=A0A9Q0FGT6_9ROSI|nr:hypothetical protein Tsubulata_001313 [Turnera subulata]